MQGSTETNWLINWPKTAARGKEKTTSYSRIPLSTLYKELKEETS
jgi:hypothetical protein